MSEADALEAVLERVMEAVWERIAAKAAAGRTVTLKLKFSDFTKITRARSAASPITTREDVRACTLALLRAELPVRLGVRLLGVTLSSLAEPGAAAGAADRLPL